MLGVGLKEKLICFPKSHNRIFPGDMFVIPAQSATVRVRTIEVVVQIDVGDEPRIKLVCNVDNRGRFLFAQLS